MLLARNDRFLGRGFIGGVAQDLAIAAQLAGFIPERRRRQM